MAHIPLSYSKISTFDSCPRQFKLQYLDKTYASDDDNPYFVKGQKLHKQLEDYVVEKIGSPTEEPDVKLAAASRNALPIINALMEKFPDIYPEQKVCVDKNYRKVAWFDNSKAFYRAIIDFLAKNDEEAVIVDYKSGKYRPYDDFGGQLHLTAFLLMMMFPKMQKVTSVYLYIEHKKTAKITITRDDLPALKEHFEGKYHEINAEVDFEPTRNQYCNFCRATPEQCKFKVAQREL